MTHQVGQTVEGDYYGLAGFVIVPVPAIEAVGDMVRFGCFFFGYDIDEVVVENVWALPDDVRAGDVAVVLQLHVGEHATDRTVTLELAELPQFW